jgi:arylsulfatase A-like enzyme
VRRPSILAACALSLVLSACTRPRLRFDDVVLVTIDTLRADHVGSYGYPRATTPFLDTLAAQGLRFANAFSSMSHTAPAHASILTALQPSQHQVLANGMQLEASVRSLADALRAAGFDTAAFVSVSFLAKLGHGFDHLDRGAEGEAWRSGEETVAAAERWLEERPLGRPLFLWVHLYDPHEYADTVAIPAELLDAMERDFGERRESLIALLADSHGWDPEAGAEQVTLLNRYDAQIAHADAALAELHDAIERRGPERRKLWVVTSDHGEALGDHGYQGHGKNLYREQMQVPLVVASSAGWWKPGVVDGLARHIDLFPTVTDLVGVELDSERLRLEGASLAVVFDGELASTPVDHAFYQRRPADEQRRRWGWEPGIVAAVQTRDAKYIWRSEGAHEFYDLATDPYELDNKIDTDTPEKERLHSLSERELRRIAGDHRVDPKGQFIDERYRDDLKALGYL